MAGKLTTGLVGLAVEAHPREKLRALYGTILKVLSDMPATAAYRKYTEDSVKQNLDAVNNTTDLTELESKLGPGQLEEVISQAKAELRLAKRFTSWKPWEPLANEPPTGQWDWP